MSRMNQLYSIYGHCNTYEERLEDLNMQLQRENRKLNQELRIKESRLQEYRARYDALHELSCLLYDKINAQKEQCEICIEKERNMACIPCGHVFCRDCIKVGEQCPLCRTEINGFMKIFI